ncbi:MAG: phosphotransferase family protein [Tissierellia bacterium]|nr:phosphotransferase family protein [Tissierellia bacterium]
MIDRQEIYLETIPKEHLEQIAEIFDINSRKIEDIEKNTIGMTNDSFIFSIDKDYYMYRLPGNGSEHFISRHQEASSYDAIKDLHISDEIVYINPSTGVKITEFYPNDVVVEQNDWDSIKKSMEILKKLHDAKLEVEHHFNIEEKLFEYYTMCKNSDCLKYHNYNDALDNLSTPLDIIRNSKEPKVLCHIDSANVNFLKLTNGDIKLLDWEYSGMSHGVTDVAMFAIFAEYSENQVLKLLEWYYGRKPNKDEILLCFSYIATAGILWSMWAEYREFHGEDFGDYSQMNFDIGTKYTKIINDYVNCND